MIRSLSHATRLFTVAAALASPVLVAAQDNRPVVVVFKFDNNSIGGGKAEFEGINTAVQDLLITDLASNPKYRLVDRNSIDAVLKEQGMVKGGQIDPATAVRLGKIMGAQYAITGGFMADGRGAAILTGRTIDMETTQIANPQKITGKSDNVLGLINDLSAKIGSEMKLDAKPGTRRVGDAGDTKDAGAKQSGTPAATPASAPASSKAAVQYAKPIPAGPSKTKLDVATMKVYSSALDEMDRKNNPEAAKLFKQVVDKFPDFEPARANLSKVSGKATN